MTSIGTGPLTSGRMTSGRTASGRMGAVGLFMTALLLAVGVMSAMPTAASAAPATAAATVDTATSNTATRAAARRVNFGAIALNPRTGWSGWSVDKASKKKAKKAAVRHCKKRSRRHNAPPKGCKGIVWVRNGCAAVAVKVKKNQIKRIGWGTAFQKKPAVKKARKKAGKKSKLHTYACTTRYY